MSATKIDLLALAQQIESRMAAAMADLAFFENIAKVADEDAEAAHAAAGYGDEGWRRSDCAATVHSSLRQFMVQTALYRRQIEQTTARYKAEIDAQAA